MQKLFHVDVDPVDELLFTQYKEYESLFLRLHLDDPARRADKHRVGDQRAMFQVGSDPDRTFGTKNNGPAFPLLPEKPSFAPKSNVKNFFDMKRAVFGALLLLAAGCSSSTNPSSSNPARTSMPVFMWV
ncbi:hypothetical protein [Alistipes megaguti]|uniref:hypothetical protein n=1 Tax=Alistipes megaguti TaxID=2364787 RepID=UPI0023552972|nr:hypothetical protein [Alistipes megaguti]